MQSIELRCAIAHRRISRFRGWSFGPSRNDGLLDFDRSQEFVGFLARRKTTSLAIVGIVLGGFRRTENDKFAAIRLDENRQIITVNGRGVPSPAMRTVIVTHARPIVGPILTAPIAGEMVEKPGHSASPKIADGNCHAR